MIAITAKRVRLASEIWTQLSAALSVLIESSYERSMRKLPFPPAFTLRFFGIVLPVFLIAPGLLASQPVSPLFVVNKGQKCGFIESSGKTVIPLSFDQCRDFSEDLAPVEINKKWGFVTRAGLLAIPPLFDEARFSF